MQSDTQSGDFAKNNVPFTNGLLGCTIGLSAGLFTVFSVIVQLVYLQHHFDSTDS